MLKDIRKTLFRFFSPFFKLGTGYRKFWYVAIFSILVILITTIIKASFFSKNDYCAKLDLPMDKQLSCQVWNGITTLEWALFTASLVPIFTRVAEIWSTQDKKIAFDDFFGFDSYSINNKNDVAIVIPDFPLKSLENVINGSYPASFLFTFWSFKLFVLNHPTRFKICFESDFAHSP